MDEDMSPTFSGSLNWLELSEIHRRDLDSNAIALYLTLLGMAQSNSMGLILVAKSSHNFGSIAYGKRSHSSRD